MMISPGGPVVMVDDNPGDLVFAQTSFRVSGLANEWVSFGSGASFLVHLVSVLAGASPAPAVVLLDIKMPAMNGLEVLERARNQGLGKIARVMCVLTSSDDPRDRARALALGADRYVTKPVDLSDYVRFFQSLGS